MRKSLQNTLKLLSYVAFFLAHGAPLAAQELTITDSARALWQSVGQVRIEGNKRSICTGTLIAPDRVLTAAHCVTDAKSGLTHPFYKVQFIAGWHNGEHVGGATAKSVSRHTAYRSGENAARDSNDIANFAADIALIKLREPLLDVAPSRIAASSRVSGPVAVLGYQTRRRETLTDYVGCHAQTTDAVFLALDCRVRSGTSGGPVFEKRDGMWQVVGVVVGTLNDKRSTIKGLAVRYDQHIQATLFDIGPF